jgi:hypothetical protein
MSDHRRLRASQDRLLAAINAYLYTDLSSLGLALDELRAAIAAAEELTP